MQKIKPTLANLAANAALAYVDAWATPSGATLEGLLSVEAANWHLWRYDGFLWTEVRAALIEAFGLLFSADFPACHADVQLCAVRVGLALADVGMRFVSRPGASSGIYGEVISVDAEVGLIKVRLYGGSGLCGDSGLDASGWVAREDVKRLEWYSATTDVEPIFRARFGGAGGSDGF